MDVHLRLGPGVSHLIGAPHLTVSLPSGATVHELLRYLRASYPAFADGSGSVLPVVDGTPVDERHVLAPGTQVALLFPISGGSVHSSQEG